jgi:hypothetical protein
MKQSTVLHGDMGPQILSHLARMCDEFSPEDIFSRVSGEARSEVFVAGQAVASAVSELYGDGSCVVYNDIDAFVMSERLSDVPEGARPRRNRLATLDYEVADIHTAAYGGLVVTPMSIYAVQSTSRDGMVNTVLSRPSVDFQHKPDARSAQFLRSFDLNCVQVAVRLSDRKLVWTPAYQDFITSRQMLVMNPKTPLHTAVRYLRKRRELEGVFGDDDQTMELLAAAERRIRAVVAQGDLTRAYRRETEAQLNMGRVYAGKAEALGNDLGKWFDLEETDAGPVQLFTLRSKSQPDARLLNQSVDSLLLPTYARALRGHWKRHICTSILECIGHDATRFTNMAVKLRHEAAVLTPEAREDVRLADQMLRAHSRMAGWLRCVPDGTHGALARAASEAAKRHGLWAYGVFETQLPYDELYELMQAQPQRVGELVGEWVDSTIERLRVEDADPKRSHRSVVPAVDFCGFRVVELATFQELAEEGVRQCHCVAGYAGAVRSGGRHIISMRKHRSTDSLTLELRWDGRRLQMGQLSGLQNRSATAEEVAVAKRLVDGAIISKALASCGLRLSASRFSALLRSDRVLFKALDIIERFVVLKGLGTSYASWSQPFSFALLAKRLLVRLRKPAAGTRERLRFTDRKGIFVTADHLQDVPWHRVLGYVLCGAFVERGRGGYGLEPEATSDLPF